MAEDTKSSADGQPSQTDEEAGAGAREGHGTARRPSDHLDRDRESEETIPRKSSLT